MNKPVLLVIGASGDVGQGIVAAALASGRTVIASARNPQRLAKLTAAHPTGLHVLAGDVATLEGATALWQAANAQSLAASGQPVSEVVVSVNAPSSTTPLADCDAQLLADLFAANVLTHFNAAKAIIPVLPATGKFIGIGGGMADLIFPGMVPVAVAQAALRNLYRGFAKEYRAKPPQNGPLIRELMVASMVNGESKRGVAQDSWVTDLDIGQHLLALLDNPDGFDAPVTVLRSREQVGKPDKAAA